MYYLLCNGTNGCCAWKTSKLVVTAANNPAMCAQTEFLVLLSSMQIQVGQELAGLGSLGNGLYIYNVQWVLPVISVQ